MQQKTTRHTIRISNSQAPDLVSRARTGWLLKRNEAISGMPNAEVYAPSIDARENQSGVNLGCLSMGDLALITDLHRLPRPELQALANGSPAMKLRSDWADLTRQLLQPMTRVQESRWVNQLIAGVRVMGPAPTAACASVEWLPGETRLVRLGRLWFASLGFQAPASGQAAPGAGRALGLDVGLSPLAVAADSRMSFQTQPLHLLAGAGLRALERQLEALPMGLQTQIRRDLEHLEFGAASQILEEFTATLLTQGTSIVAEQLDLAGFTGSFVPRGRSLAVIDWHQSWLPQRLYAAGVPFKRVAPAYTSRRCCRCGRLGEREGARFTCSQCGPENAHVNAARNLLRRGGAVRRPRDRQ